MSNAFSTDFSSERLQSRWDPEYHSAVEQNKASLQRLEGLMNKEEALALALEILGQLDTEARKDLRVMGRGRPEHIDVASIERGMRDDPFLGLCLAQAAGQRQADRVAHDLSSRQDALVGLRANLARVDQQELPLEPSNRRSTPRP